VKALAESSAFISHVENIKERERNETRKAPALHVSS